MNAESRESALGYETIGGNKYCYVPGRPTKQPSTVVFVHLEVSPEFPLPFRQENRREERQSSDRRPAEPPGTVAFTLSRRKFVSAAGH